MVSSIKFKFAYLGALVSVSAILAILKLLFADFSLPAFVFPLITCAVISLFGVTAFVFRKKLKISFSCACLPTTFSSSAVGFLFLTSVIIAFFIKSLISSEYYVEDANLVISVLVKVFAALSAVYFLLSAAWMGFHERHGLLLGLSFAPILFFAARTLNEFINNSTNPLINGRGYLIFAMIAYMLFFLNESKAIVSRENVFLYLFFGSAAVILTAIYDVSNLSSYLDGSINPLCAIYSILSVALAIHVCSRIACLPINTQKKSEMLLDEDGMIVDKDVFIPGDHREDNGEHGR